MKDFIAGKYVNQGTYKSFQPEFINKNWLINNMELLELLSLADRHLGRLDMFSNYIPDIDLFVSMHITKEATQSSKIEGTKTNIEEVLKSEENVEIEKRDDWQEVNNYINALNFAVGNLEKLPFSSRLIKETHRILLQGVRGKHKSPGNFRTSQNWIGGVSLSDASFIPPIAQSVNDYMSDLEKFVHNSEIHFPELLKIALIHYQFETVHPFLDGNGRVGRLIITLYLVEKEILKRPILYLSDFFEKNRFLYYDNLMKVRLDNDIEHWFKFFLMGVIETAKSSIETFDKILQLKKRVDEQVYSMGARANKFFSVLNELYRQPFVDVQKVRISTGLSLPSAYKLIKDFEKMGILKEVTGSKRDKLFVFENYLKLFMD